MLCLPSGESVTAQAPHSHQTVTATVTTWKTKHLKKAGLALDALFIASVALDTFGRAAVLENKAFEEAGLVLDAFFITSVAPDTRGRAAVLENKQFEESET